MLSTSSEWRSREGSANANDALIYEDYIDSEDIVCLLYTSRCV